MSNGLPPTHIVCGGRKGSLDEVLLRGAEVIQNKKKSKKIEER